MKLRTVILAFAVLAVPFTAHAQKLTGSYVSVGAGINKLQQEDVDAQLVDSPSTDIPGEVLTSIGPAIVGAFGHGFKNGLRVEVEGSYRSNHIKGESGLSGEDFATGTEGKTGLMANGVYEVGGAHVSPYFGGGMGAQFVHEPDANSTSGGVTVNVEGGTKSSFAYQLIAGAAFPIHSHHLSLTVEYRFLDLVGTRTYKGTATIPGVGSFELEDHSTNDRNHSIVASIRYGFGG